MRWFMVSTEPDVTSERAQSVTGSALLRYASACRLPRFILERKGAVCHRVHPCIVLRGSVSTETSGGGVERGFCGIWMTRGTTCGQGQLRWVGSTSKERQAVRRHTAVASARAASLCRAPRLSLLCSCTLSFVRIPLPTSFLGATCDCHRMAQPPSRQ